MGRDQFKTSNAKDFVHVGKESLDETLRRLRVDPTVGLAGDEVRQRQQAQGPNEFATVRLGGKALEILRAAASPLVLILLFAGVVSAIVGEETNALLISGIVLLSMVLNLWQTYRSERAVRSLQKKISQTATVLREGKWGEIPRREIVVGDILRLSAGDLVPADARLLTSRDLHVQQAALTGESLPVEKDALSDSKDQSGVGAVNLVYLGTSIVVGSATAVVIATGRNTAFGDIVERISSRPEETEFEKGTRQFGYLIMQTVLFLILFILIINIALGREALQSLLFSLALAVGLTPEFLPMITTVTLSQGAIRMAKDKVLVKHLSSIQNLGSMDVLCSDKTGTLTLGTMTLQASLDCNGQASEQSFFWAYLNSKFESGIKSPVDEALLARPTPGGEGFTKLDEVPFDFERRRLSIVVQDPQDVRFLITKGAPENILECCSHLEWAGQEKPLGPGEKARCLEVFRDLSLQGYRAIGVASKKVEKADAYTRADEAGLTFRGFVTFADPLAENVKESLSTLRQIGVQIKILTGDNEWVTRRICRDVGMERDRIVSGQEIEKMDGVVLERTVREVDIFARVSPAQKQQVIRALKASGHVVGFLGDGINDAPSLHDADVGISVAGAVDVAREASDIILLERRLDVLRGGILAGRRAFGNVLKYILMGTSSNFGNMFSMAGAALFLPFLPMLPTQILLNNFLYDLAQISIPSDEVDRAYLKAPHKWDLRLIRNFMLLIGPISSLFDFLTFYVLLKVFYFGEVLFHTGWFVESLVTQVLVVFVIRTLGNPLRNRPSRVLTFTALSVVVLAMLLPYSLLAKPLHFGPLPLFYFYFLTGATLLYLLLVEIVKRRVVRRFF